MDCAHATNTERNKCAENKDKTFRADCGKFNAICLSRRWRDILVVRVLLCVCGVCSKTCVFNFTLLFSSRQIYIYIFLLNRTKTSANKHTFTHMNCHFSLKTIEPATESTEYVTAYNTAHCIVRFVSCRVFAIIVVVFIDIVPHRQLAIGEPMLCSKGFLFQVSALLRQYIHTDGARRVVFVVSYYYLSVV